MNWTELIGQTLIHFVWQGGLLMGVAMGFLALLRNRSAQARYVALCGVLLLMAFSPFITAAVISPEARISPMLSVATERAIHSELSPGDLSVPTGAELPTPVPMPNEAALRWIVIGWLVGVGVLTVRVLGGVITLTGLARNGRLPVPEELQERFRSLANRMGLRRFPKFYLSDRVTVPTVIGAFRGVVLLPVSVATGMSPRLLETILVHELAHVARFDFLINAFQAVIEVVLFYHPAVWWVSQRIREERENCCDDLVIATLSDRKAYAHALTALAELRGHSLAMRADGGELLVRVRRILGESSMKSILSPLPVAILIGAVVLVPTIQGFAARPEPPAIGSPTQSSDKKTTSTAGKSKPKVKQGADKASNPFRTPDPVGPRAKVSAGSVVPNGQNPLGQGAKTFSADVVKSRDQNPLGLPAKTTSQNANSKTDANPLSIPRTDVGGSQKASDKIPSSNNPLAGGGPSLNSSDHIPPASKAAVDQGWPRTPRQAVEYHIEQLNLDIEALLGQRRFVNQMLTDVRTRLLEMELELEAARFATSEQEQKEAEAKQRQLRSTMLKVTAQIKVLERNLEMNDERLADKRQLLEKAWKIN